jgi:hypothetical protein
MNTNLHINTPFRSAHMLTAHGYAIREMKLYDCGVAAHSYRILLGHQFSGAVAAPLWGPEAIPEFGAWRNSHGLARLASQ